MDSHNQNSSQKDKDFSISGALIICGIFVLIVFIVYLLSIQKKAENCVESVRPDGTVVTVCKPEVLNATSSGQVELLDNLRPETDEVEKTLLKQLGQ